MTQIIKDNAWNVSKLTLLIAVLGLCYTMYRDLSNKIDMVLSIKQEIADHKDGDKDFDIQMITQISDVNKKLDAHLATCVNPNPNRK